MPAVHRIQVVDSHTGGEPTRVVIGGGPDLGTGSIAERRRVLAEQHDRLRTTVVGEPRGSDALVGALLCRPTSPEAAAGVIFFNNVGYLNMCGHGTIGLMVTLAHLGRIDLGRHAVETPVGVVRAELQHDGTVRLENVPAWRLHGNVSLNVPGVGIVTGDVAWGGNWFFLCSDHGLVLDRTNLPQLLDVTHRIRHALRETGITGSDRAEIDHIELTAPADSNADCRSFVLCPGGAWDRSPCGTGTSAKLACLAADQLLQPGEMWRQESLVGSVFNARFRMTDERIHGQPVIIPEITGSAWITATAELHLGASDPFRHGIVP